ncbi:methyl-accepting chemotaxis protein [Alkalibacterium subtropicum]|uniref:Methyl-accepting chemotaxis protein n=1 Tax=Alkalibacterium subtropicum TaxID=753702 RepID=A0A1I1IXK7_9LACT|nr:methyl-accepting chemotaxis protein [Alkalibacterium subtropicum]SFC41007.1 methyl-accepting chemotaxis protein [Alkalibacterium subtropicum]
MNKNKLMIGLASITFGLNFLVHLFHRLNLIESMTHGSVLAREAGSIPDYYTTVTGLFFALPLVLLLIAAYLTFTKPAAQITPYLVTLSLTFSVISMIMGGEGAVEYHFGIFMVIAMMAYYNSIPLVSLMSSIFIVQHLLGYFYLPATLFVYGPGSYSFVMVLIHATFLILTAGAVIWQIASNQKQVDAYEALNKTNEETIRSIISQLSETNDRVDETAKQLNHNAVQTQSSSEEVQSSILTIRSGSKKQVDQAQQSQTVLDSFSSSIQTIEENTARILTSSKLMTNESTEGFTLVEQTTKEMTNMSEAFQQVKQVVESLDSRSKEIDSIITVISAISEKTNLLALNAAIEAAQAGEAGKGFAVVANEVRKLSEQTDEAVGKVAEIVQAIQVESTEAKQSVGVGETKMADSLNSVSQTETKFDYILDAVKQLDSDIKETASTSSAISQNAKRILESLDIMQEIAEDTEQTTKTADSQSVKQLALIKETTEIAQSLSLEVEKLSPLIQRLQGNSDDEQPTKEMTAKKTRFSFKRKAAPTL